MLTRITYSKIKMTTCVIGNLISPTDCQGIDLRLRGDLIEMLSKICLCLLIWVRHGFFLLTMHFTNFRLYPKIFSSYGLGKRSKYTQLDYGKRFDTTLAVIVFSSRKVSEKGLLTLNGILVKTIMLYRGNAG